MLKTSKCFGYDIYLQGNAEIVFHDYTFYTIGNNG